jgi:hypothetical protein
MYSCDSTSSIVTPTANLLWRPGGGSVGDGEWHTRDLGLG